MSTERPTLLYVTDTVHRTLYQGTVRPTLCHRHGPPYPISWNGLLFAAICMYVSMYVCMYVLCNAEVVSLDDTRIHHLSESLCFQIKLK